MAENKQEQPGYKISDTPSAPASNVKIESGVPRVIGGRKRALLIGINYTGSKSALRGCIQDVQNVRELLVSTYNFPTDKDSMVILTDCPENASKPEFLPTRANMENAFKWLVGGSNPGDSLFLHFSGHGGQKADVNKDEEDGFDETLIPLDYETNGEIIDDQLHEMIVRPLQAGVRLMALLDCCHSGSGLDLPFCYLPGGQSKHQKSVLLELATDAIKVGQAYMKGDKMGAIKGVFDMFTKSRGSSSSESSSGGSSSQSNPQRDAVKKDKTSKADVFMLSGCMDTQTSADACIDNKATGAMSWALLSSLRSQPSQSYAQLLGSTRQLLASKYSQIPQLSAGHDSDMNQYFAL